ncbi:macrophage mannose receptor 1-like [Cottoperca gobio]|uniref:Macrophage mannose receptor 1-like n=1 Tax=Cottoperca gobio TaxID=56716 RepID=A0A6J2PVK5_COTGO|nr:macrophage mannose receptor 1-like [Cottoperca gobio]
MSSSTAPYIRETVKGGMEWKTFIFVVLSGLCYLPACSSDIDVFVEQGETWSDAQSSSRLKYTDLDSSDNREELDKVMDTGIEYYTGYLWLGHHNDFNSWRWSLEKEGYYGEGETEVRMWMTDKPNDLGGYENCAAMNADGLWDDKRCDETQLFVCYNGGVETVASSSFIFVNQSKTWTEAQSYCREHFTDLASVRNQAENDQIKKMTQNQPTWIGLYRDAWKWSDGGPMPFRHCNANNNDVDGKSNSLCVDLYRGQLEGSSHTMILCLSNCVSEAEVGEDESN